MKKIATFALLLGLIFSITACGNTDINLQDVYDASQTEAILKNHESMYLRDEMDGEFLGEKYLTKEYLYEYIYDAEYDYAEFMTDDVCYANIAGDYVRYFPITPDGVGDGFASYRAEQDPSILLSADTVDETMESVTKKDGRITVTSVLSPKILEDMAEYGVTAGAFEYVLDAKTREIISFAGNYTFDDGTGYGMTSEIRYDTESPEMVNVFLGYDNQTEDLRTITVVSNPGTEQEISQSVQAAKGLIIGFRYDDDETGYEFDVFTDAACTEAYDPYMDTDSDLIIYVKWDK